MHSKVGVDADQVRIEGSVVNFGQRDAVSLGTDPESRQAAYRELVRQAISDDDLAAIRLHLQRQHALGNERFRAAIEAQLGRSAGPAKVGRPRKAAERAL